LPLGEKDRSALDVALGVLPSPKGPTFITNNAMILGSGKSVMDQQRSGADDDDLPIIDDKDGPDLDRLFPPANSMQERLTQIRQRSLPDGK
jgi:hypothetical protein